MSEHTDLQSLKDYTAEDKFNYLHRHEAGLDRHYATDVDLVLVEKHPRPHIPGFIEFKRQGEPIRYTQAVVFSELQEIAPVYKVESEIDIMKNDPPNHNFTVKKFNGVIDSNPSPPIIDWQTVHENICWGGRINYKTSYGWEESGGDGLIGWEEELRNQIFQTKTPDKEGQTGLCDY